jgi:uncharacterized protein (DUF2147 family)
MPQFLQICRRVAFIALALAPVRSESAQPPSPAGIWTTYNDRTGLPEGVVRITEVGREFIGTVVEIRSATDPNPTCDRCQGDDRGKPVLGMTILRGLRREGDSFVDGSILDPDDGRVYRCNATLRDGGRKLELRGYVGLPYFGRTQTWVRGN